MVGKYLEYNSKILMRYHTCNFCNTIFNKGDLVVIVQTYNKTIIEDVFGLSKNRQTRKKLIYLCQSCFEEIHNYLESIESEGWETL